MHPCAIALLHGVQIISGGSEAFVSHWSVNGDQKAHVPCSPTSVYNVAVNNQSDSYRVRTNMPLLYAAVCSMLCDIIIHYNASQ